jgi:hypothetical protein
MAALQVSGLVLHRGSGQNLDSSVESIVKIPVIYDGDTADFAFTSEDSPARFEKHSLLKAAG